MFKNYNKYAGVIAPDYKDSRTYQIADVQLSDIQLPDSFNLDPLYSTPVERQIYGTCVSNAVCNVGQFLFSKLLGRTINLSERFNHYNTKVISGLWHIQGDYVRNGLQALRDVGAVLESEWQESSKLSWEEYIKTKPSSELHEKAKEFAGGTYWATGKTLQNFRETMFQQKAPVAFSMEWYKSYNKPFPDGRLPLPDTKVSGHAMATAFWKDEKFWIKNSFGKHWGKNGYFYIPFKEWTKHNIWNAYAYLNKKKPEFLEGWVAVDYLAPIQLIKGTEMETKANLNVRDNPAGNKVGQVKKGGKIKVVGSEVIKARYGSKYYLWQKVQLEA